MLLFLQALAKAGRAEDKVSDHVLVEDVQVGWEKKDQDRQSVQRILDMSEKVLQAQNKWRGAGKFLLRKLSDVSVQGGPKNVQVMK